MMAGESDTSFVDGFAAVSVVLAVVTVLFGVRYPEVMAALAEDAPAGAQARNAYRRRLQDTLHARLMPLLILFWTFALLPVPGTVQILRAIDLDPNHYDFIRAAWVATDAGMVYFAVWSSVLAYRLWAAIRAAQ